MAPWCCSRPPPRPGPPPAPAHAGYRPGGDAGEICRPRLPVPCARAGLFRPCPGRGAARCAGDPAPARIERLASHLRALGPHPLHALPRRIGRSPGPRAHRPAPGALLLDRVHGGDRRGGACSPRPSPPRGCRQFHGRACCHPLRGRPPRAGGGRRAHQQRRRPAAGGRGGRRLRPHAARVPDCDPSGAAGAGHPHHPALADRAEPSILGPGPGARSEPRGGRPLLGTAALPRQPAGDDRPVRDPHHPRLGGGACRPQGPSRPHPLGGGRPALPRGGRPPLRPRPAARRARAPCRHRPHPAGGGSAALGRRPPPLPRPGAGLWGAGARCRIRRCRCCGAGRRRSPRRDRPRQHRPRPRLRPSGWSPEGAAVRRPGARPLPGIGPLRPARARGAAPRR